MVSLVNAFRDLARVREVSSVLVRHGFGEVVGRIGIGGRAKVDSEGKPGSQQVSVAMRIRLVLEELGPSFVKLGQLASTRSDLLPEDLVVELRKLQDNARAISFEEIRSQIEWSLGCPIEEKFEEFEQTPLAAASIAQVHRAKLKTPDGLRDVAVKVQRPHIARTIASDVEILHTLAALLERAIPETRIYSPIGLVQQFDHAIVAELDFLAEAENARRFTQNFAGDQHVKFPYVYRQATSKQVLTLEFIPGTKVTESVKLGFDGHNIARLCFRAMMKQIYEDGFFHADPHPGNVFVGGSPEHPIIGIVDLGMVGRLSPRMRELTIDVVVACLRQDHDAIAEALYAIGTPTRKVDMNAFRAEVAVLSEKYLGKAIKDIEISAMVRDLVRGGTKFGIEIPTDFVMMGKSLMTIEGIGKEIDPEFDFIEEARPIFSELLRKRYSPERLGSELLRKIERLGGAGYKVPQQLEEVLDDLRLGRLSVIAKNADAVAATEHLGRRLFTGILFMAQLIAGVILLIHHERTYAHVLLFTSLCTLGIHTFREFWALVRRK